MEQLKAIPFNTACDGLDMVTLEEKAKHTRAHTPLATMNTTTYLSGLELPTGQAGLLTAAQHADLTCTLIWADNLHPPSIRNNKAVTSTVNEVNQVTSVTLKMSAPVCYALVKSFKRSHYRFSNKRASIREKRFHANRKHTCCLWYVEGLTFNESKQAITLPLSTWQLLGGWANLHSSSLREQVPLWNCRHTSSVSHFVSRIEAMFRAMSAAAAVELRWSEATGFKEEAILWGGVSAWSRGKRNTHTTTITATCSNKSSASGQWVNFVLVDTKVEVLDWQNLCDQIMRLHCCWRGCQSNS